MDKFAAPVTLQLKVVDWPEVMVVGLPEKELMAGSAGVELVTVNG